MNSTHTNIINTNKMNNINAGLGKVLIDTYSYANNLITNPVLLSIILISTLVYIGVFKTNNTINLSLNNSIVIIAIVIISILSIINLSSYLSNNTLKSMSKIDKEIEKNILQTNNIVDDYELTKEVYNIPDNNFTYSDAKTLCSAYGSRLATYKEIEESYDNGAEWCNYGWSDGQMALFPTQEKTWNKLQHIEGHEHDCGRPGINGGFISNPNVKFGVNCYGYKPTITTAEKNIMANKQIYPKTEKDLENENKIKYWKNILNDILISPFNHTRWNE